MFLIWTITFLIVLSMPKPVPIKITDKHTEVCVENKYLFCQMLVQEPVLFSHHGERKGEGEGKGEKERERKGRGERKTPHFVAIIEVSVHLIMSSMILSVHISVILSSSLPLFFSSFIPSFLHFFLLSLFFIRSHSVFFPEFTILCFIYTKSILFSRECS